MNTHTTETTELTPADVGSSPEVSPRVAARIAEHQLNTTYADMRVLYNGMVCRAGFVVLREGCPPSVLFVKQSRSGFDGFPKGISDPDDDSAVATALRELREETGITPDKFLDISTVVWAVPRKDFNEVCFFFMCKVSADVAVVVDGDEILSYGWTPLADLCITSNMAFVTQSMISDIRAIDVESAFV